MPYRFDKLFAKTGGSILNFLPSGGLGWVFKLYHYVETEP